MSIITMLILLINSIFINITPQKSIPSEGYIVAYVENNSIAQRIGLKVGDIVLSANGKSLSYERKYIGLFSDSGKSIGLIVLRNGDTLKIKGKTEKAKEYLGAYCIYYNNEDMLTPLEMKEDVDTLISVILDVHPDPFASLSREKFETLKNKIYKEISDSMNIIKFWEKVAYFVAKLEDGHTHVFPPKDIFYRDLFVRNEKIVFPFAIKIYKDTLVVLKNYSNEKDIKPGDLIVSINDVPVKTVVDSLITFASGELRHFRTSFVEKMFNMMLYYVYGWKDTFNIKVLRNNKVIKCTLAAGDGRTYERMLEDYGRENKEAFEFQEIPALQTAVLIIRTFSSEYKERFDKFLKEAFQKIRKRGYRYLVIDVRENTGGSTVLVEDLLNYISDKPYRIFSMVKEKFSRHRGFDSTYVETFTLKEKVPPENPLRFEGKVFVLTSNIVFSAANGFVLVCKDYGIATIVGEETGGVPNSFGDVYYTVLPNSGFTTGVSFKYFVRPNGDTSYIKEGVKPDIHVRISPHDISEGKDPVMEKVKEIIRKDIESTVKN